MPGKQPDIELQQYFVLHQAPEQLVDNPWKDSRETEGNTRRRKCFLSPLLWIYFLCDHLTLTHSPLATRILLGTFTHLYWVVDILLNWKSGFDLCTIGLHRLKHWLSFKNFAFPLKCQSLQVKTVAERALKQSCKNSLKPPAIHWMYYHLLFMYKQHY